MANYVLGETLAGRLKRQLGIQEGNARGILVPRVNPPVPVGRLVRLVLDAPLYACDTVGVAARRILLSSGDACRPRSETVQVADPLGVVRASLLAILNESSGGWYVPAGTLVYATWLPDWTKYEALAFGECPCSSSSESSSSDSSQSDSSYWSSASESSYWGSSGSGSLVSSSSGSSALAGCEAYPNFPATIPGSVPAISSGSCVYNGFSVGMPWDPPGPGVCRWYYYEGEPGSPTRSMTFAVTGNLFQLQYGYKVGGLYIGATFMKVVAGVVNLSDIGSLPCVSPSGCTGIGWEATVG